MKKSARKAKPRKRAAAAVARPANHGRPTRRNVNRKPRTMGEWLTQFRTMFPEGTRIERPAQQPLPPSLKLDLD
ncbi:MAG: hypothetical protein ABL962_19550 [Fimbriimonadaceae bacterium]